MKKLFFLIIFLTPALAKADTNTDNLFNPSQLILNATVVAILYLASTFIISLIKMRLDAQFRNKLIESERSEEMIAQLLRPVEEERKDEAFRTMAIFGGISAGLALAYASQPIGIHSVAIMGFCLTLSFLAYYLYLHRKKDRPADN